MAKYSIVTVRITNVLPSSVWVVRKNRLHAQNVPRSLLHGGDDLKLERMARDCDVELRVVDWKADELGLS